MNDVPKYYSLEAEEIRVSKNLKNLIKLLDEYGLPKKPDYILEEIAFMERELKYLKEERCNRYYKKSEHPELAFINA